MLNDLNRRKCGASPLTDCRCNQTVAHCHRMRTNQMVGDAFHCLRSLCDKCVAKFCKKEKKLIRYSNAPLPINHKTNPFSMHLSSNWNCFFFTKDSVISIARIGRIQSNHIKFCSFHTEKSNDKTKLVVHFVWSPRSANQNWRNPNKHNALLPVTVTKQLLLHAYYVAIVISCFSPFLQKCARA